MKKIYFIAPLSALVVFAGVYAQHRSASSSAREAEAARETAAREAQVRADRESRAAAVEAALKTQRERKAEKDAAEAVEKLALESRRRALDAREETRGKRDRADRRLKALDREIAEALASVEAARKAGEIARAESAHLKTLVAKTEDNRRALAGLLTKVSAAPAPAASAADRT